MWSRWWSVILVWFFTLAGCQFGSRSENSYLIIAVDRLGFDTMTCDETFLSERELDGFLSFCNQSVRFTHAFTSSTLSVPAISTLLTGLYPMEHKVRDNGNKPLSASFETVAEVAYRKKYHTSFFSSGAPVLRKSGLAQGFHHFDDNIEPTWTALSRSAKDVTKLFVDWHERENYPERFFSFLYLSDLQMSHVKLRSKQFGENERGFMGRLRKVDEALTFVEQTLKNRKAWNSTTVVLVGLNGNPKDREGEFAPINLHSDNTQVVLMVKPAQKPRDEPMSWAVDWPVSIVDLGATLNDWLGEDQTGKAEFGEELPRTSLKSLIEKMQQPQTSNRILWVESGWPDWQFKKQIRWSLRIDQFLVILDRDPKIYNTLLDRQEMMKVPTSDPLWRTLSLGVMNKMQQVGIQSWPGLDPAIFRSIKKNYTELYAWKEQPVGQSMARSFGEAISLPLADKALQKTLMWLQQAGSLDEAAASEGRVRLYREVQDQNYTLFGTWGAPMSLIGKTPVEKILDEEIFRSKKLTFKRRLASKNADID